MVGPKADGHHALLLYESHTGHFYLISHSHSPQRIEGEYNGNEKVSFLLEIEVVSTSLDSNTILAYDMKAISSKAIESPHVFKTDYYHNGIGHGFILISYEKRYLILQKLLNAIELRRTLLLKPIAPARHAEAMWKIWQCLPYRTDGLIFTPCLGLGFSKSLSKSIKWKPKSNADSRCCSRRRN